MVSTTGNEFANTYVNEIYALSTSLHRSNIGSAMQEQKTSSRIFPSSPDDDIVISGISGKFPNAKNVDEFEHKLYNK
ncbi:hypothetical protein Bhyg_15629, partial [Pseudolycoriella hygida]